jgi:hypothetical protein
MSQRPEMEEVDWVVAIQKPDGDKLQLLAVAIIGRKVGDEPDHGTMIVNVAPGVTPAELMPAFNDIAQSFATQNVSAENKGVPITLNGDPVQ